MHAVGRKRSSFGLGGVFEGRGGMENTVVWGTFTSARTAMMNKQGKLFSASSSFLSALATLAIAWGSAGAAQAATKVPEIDRSKPIDLNRYSGEERPDNQGVLDAFSAQLNRLGECVDQAKKRAKAQDSPWEGGAMLTILLNPEGMRPLGVNAKLPEAYSKDKKLVDCLRLGTWMAEYPSYDGPPVEVDFEFELDPGYDWVEE